MGWPKSVRHLWNEIIFFYRYRKFGRWWIWFVGWICFLTLQFQIIGNWKNLLFAFLFFFQAGAQDIPLWHQKPFCETWENIFFWPPLWILNSGIWGLAELENNFPYPLKIPKMLKRKFYLKILSFQILHFHQVVHFREVFFGKNPWPSIILIIFWFLSFAFFFLIRGRQEL